MRLNSFSVRVLEGTEDNSGYVALKHNTQYTLQLRNDHGVPCDCSVEIDGKVIGKFRIGAHDKLRLERPAHDKGRFTFLELGTPEAEQAQLEDNPNLGLIKCTFTPEKIEPVSTVFWQYHYPYHSNWNYWNRWCYPEITYGNYTACSLFSQSCSNSTGNAGGTGLTGESNQEFVTVNALNYNYSQETVIHLRLISKKENVVRPLTTYSTPVPPRV